MACASCLAHRAAIKAAVKSGDAGAIVTSTIRAASALGENAGRRLIRVARKPKT